MKAVRMKDGGGSYEEGGLGRGSREQIPVELHLLPLPTVSSKVAP